MDMFIDCLRGKPELRDYKSPEKDIIKEKFNNIPYMDMWICSIIEGYIYEKVSKVNEYSGSKEEYTDRYGKKEGEYKMWHPNGQLFRQSYYKEGKYEGEFKWWWNNGQLRYQYSYKEGKLDGEAKEWNEQSDLIVYKIYTGGEVVEDLQRTHRDEVALS